MQECKHAWTMPVCCTCFHWLLKGSLFNFEEDSFLENAQVNLSSRWHLLRTKRTDLIFTALDFGHRVKGWKQCRDRFWFKEGSPFLISYICIIKRGKRQSTAQPQVENKCRTESRRIKARAGRLGRLWPRLWASTLLHTWLDVLRRFWRHSSIGNLYLPGHSPISRILSKLERIALATDVSHYINQSLAQVHE